MSMLLCGTIGLNYGKTTQREAGVVQKLGLLKTKLLGCLIFMKKKEKTMLKTLV